MRYINDDKKFKKFPLLSVLLFHIQAVGVQVLRNPKDAIAKEFFLNKISAL